MAGRGEAAPLRRSVGPLPDRARWVPAVASAAGARPAHRGDVRAAVLALLAEQPMHGYQIIQELEERTGGAWRVEPRSPSTPPSRSLEDVGLVSADKDRGQAGLPPHRRGPRGRRGAPATASRGRGDRRPRQRPGRPARRARATSPPPPCRSANAGNDAQVAAAKKVLADARRQLYLLLAEVDTDETDTSADRSGGSAPAAADEQGDASVRAVGPSPASDRAQPTRRLARRDLRPRVKPRSASTAVGVLAEPGHRPIGGGRGGRRRRRGT